MFPTIVIPPKGDLIPNKSVKKSLVSCSLINLNFLLPKRIILLNFIFSTFSFLLSVFF